MLNLWLICLIIVYIFIDIKHIRNWNLENAHWFYCMFKSCKSLKDINALQNWNMSKAQSVCNMFEFCKNSVNADSLYKWKLSDKVERINIFNGCDKWLNIHSVFKKPSPSSAIDDQMKFYVIIILLVLLIGFIFIGAKILKVLFRIIRYVCNLILGNKN